MFKKWFHKHQWWPVGIDHYRDTSYAKPGSPGVKSTSVTSRCLICGELKVDHLFGAGLLKLEDLQSQAQLEIKPEKPKPRRLPDWLKIIK